MLATRSDAVTCEPSLMEVSTDSTLRSSSSNPNGLAWSGSRDCHPQQPQEFVLRNSPACRTGWTLGYTKETNFKRSQCGAKLEEESHFIVLTVFMYSLLVTFEGIVFEGLMSLRTRL